MFNKLFESRALTFQSLWGNDLDASLVNQSGTHINSETAFRVHAIYAAVSLISDTIATLPLDAYFRRDGARFAFRPKPAWVSRPSVDELPTAFWGAITTSLLIDGNAFIRIYRSGGEIVNLVVLNPTTVEIKRNGIGRVIYNVAGENNALTTNDILHIPNVTRPGQLRGISPVEVLKDNWGLNLAMESYAARFFGQGATMAGHIEYPGALNQEQAKNLAESFQAAHSGFRKSHKIGILSNGASFKATSVNPEDSQLIEARRLAVEDVARVFNIPPHKMGLPGTTTYASVEQNNIAFSQDVIRPIVYKLETAFGFLLTETPGAENAFLKFNMDALVRSDINSRMSAYSTGLNSGFLTVNDVRRYEDLTPQNDPSADQVRVPLANVNISAAGINEQEAKVKMAQQLIQVGFDPASVLANLNLPAMTHTGLASTQLQAVAQIDPENPQSVYGVE